MFKELLPILRHRAVLFTVTHLENDDLRVNVMPQKLKDSDNEALTTPLSLTGPAEQLDTELAQTLVGFVGSHLQLANTLTKAQAEMDAAAKAAQAEARSKAKNVKPGKSNDTVPTSAPERKDPAPVTAQSGPTLFDSADEDADEEASILEEVDAEAA